MTDEMITYGEGYYFLCFYNMVISGLIWNHNSISDILIVYYEKHEINRVYFIIE